MKKIVYTVLLGDYKLNEPHIINHDWELICFTDQNIKSEYWRIIKVEGGKKKSRHIKIRLDQYMDYDICLYIDAKFTIRQNLKSFIKDNLKSDLCLMRHNKRNCAYDEGEFCIKIGKDKKEIIEDQLNIYRNVGFPKQFGLFAPGIMIKRNTEEVNRFMEQWYDQVERYSYRDIISFSYTLWLNPINLSLMNFKETYKRFI